MNVSDFARILRSEKRPAAVKVRNFAGRVAGRLPVKPSEMRVVKRFLEAEGDDATVPAWVGKRNEDGKTTPEDHLSAGIKKAMLAVIDNEDLDWNEKLTKLKAYIVAHAKLKDDDDAETVAEWLLTKAGKSRRGRRGRRTLTEAQIGAGVPLGKGRHELREDVYQGDGLTVRGNVVEGVKILGLSSLNGRRYLMECVREAVPQYEGLRSNLNHPSKATDPRLFQDRFGKLENVHAVEGDGLRGNLRFNPEHPQAKSFAWWAANEPGMIGLSHNAVGEGDNQGGVFVVRRLVKVRSVDVVADAATTGGLAG